ncbi:MAG: sugar-binding domain-containing protein [Bacteroidota bacterium]
MRKVKIILTVILSQLTLPESFSQDTDKFAKIGNMQGATREHLLEEQVPDALPDLRLPVKHEEDAVFDPFQLMDTEEELEAELSRLRKEHMVYLEDFAPEISVTRRRIGIEAFDWRVEEETDITDFTNVLEGKGKWERVRVPHYGPPLGRAVTYYRKEVVLDDDIMQKGSLFLCFEGVDYKAHVFWNGSFLGSHEGFFAPFEFDITRVGREGENTLVVKVENDFATLGSSNEKGDHEIGNKIYAASGPGYDDPELGWHHCPPGMGIYQECYIESRDPLHINNVFVRPQVDTEEAEVWVEVNNFSGRPEQIKLQLSLYGQNFDSVFFEGKEYIPRTIYIPGLGDLAKPDDWKELSLEMGYGVNFLKFRVPVKHPRLWCNDTPWLYQLQIKLLDSAGKITDEASSQFGMRSFTMDTVSIPKGMMYLNGEKIRLRGANTMGYMQQDVIKKDWDQLIDDILLAKACNMNFIRVTQRPVQEEIYEYADKLGLMLQTDLPLFGVLRPNQFTEAVRQAGEMERLVRNHPSNIMVTYINERFPNAVGNPHRNIASASDYNKFFKACDQAVLFANPDRVIKAGDGDYDPPSPGLPDNHCYNMWYNGHGLGLGEMHQGYWQPVKPGWYYACGEFGAEGLDPVSTMRKYYPAGWLPANREEEKSWTPLSIAASQTTAFHYLWYNTQYGLESWVEASQEHQARATRLQTEAMRRNNDMVSFAIHLFIDAWPAGWMKTIMDVDRQPKKAFFAYRDALNPLMVSLRTDRYHFCSGEQIDIEAWLSNDLNKAPEGYRLNYQFEKNGKVFFAHSVDPQLEVNGSKFQGYISFNAPKVSKRMGYKLRLGLFDESGGEVSQSVIDIDVWPEVAAKGANRVFVAESTGNAHGLLSELEIVQSDDMSASDVIIIDNYEWYSGNRELVDRLVKSGKTALFMELPEGNYQIADSEVSLFNTIMGNYYFVSPETGHDLIRWAKPMDFHFWYNEKEQVVTPLIGTVFKAGDWTPILSSGLTSWDSRDNGKYLAVAEKRSGKGKYVICQLQLNERTKTNPAAKKLAYGLLGL